MFFGDGPQRANRCDATGRLGDEIKNHHTAEEHQYPLQDIGPHYRHEAPHRGVEHDDHERYADSRLIGNAQKHLKEMARTLKDGKQIEQACKHDDNP